MIVVAAIRNGEMIFTMPRPARHHNILQHRLMDFYSLFPHEEGFISSDGEFLDRKEAYRHAIDCGQGTPRRDRFLLVNPNAYNGDDLYSEDLW